MSLKGTVLDYEVRTAISDAKNGKKKAVIRVSEYAQKGYISTEEYNRITQEYHINRDKKKKKTIEIIKSAIAVIILFVSMLCCLAYLIERDGKGTAFWYFFLWIWAFFCVCSNRKE